MLSTRGRGYLNLNTKSNEDEGTFVKKLPYKCKYTIGVIRLPQGDADPSSAAQEMTSRK